MATANAVPRQYTRKERTVVEPVKRKESLTTYKAFVAIYFNVMLNLLLI